MLARTHALGFSGNLYGPLIFQRHLRLRLVEVNVTVFRRFPREQLLGSGRVVEVGEVVEAELGLALQVKRPTHSLGVAPVGLNVGSGRVQVERLRGG